MNVAENSTYQVYGRKMINSVTIFQAAEGCIKNDSNEGWPFTSKDCCDYVGNVKYAQVPFNFWNIV